MEPHSDFFDIRARDAIRWLIADRWYAALGRIKRGRRRFPALASAGCVLLAAAVLWHWGGTWWRMLVPMARPEWDGLPADLRAQAEGQFRLFAVQATAAIGGVVALAYTARNYRLSRRGQMTDRLVKALERLGSAEEYIRLGGVLALEQIAHDAPDQAQHIVQILQAFVRRHAPRAAFRKPEEGGGEAPSPEQSVLPEVPASDVQAALTLMTRPFLARRPRLVPELIESDGDVLGAPNLNGLHLQGADLSGAWLKGAQLDGTNLTRARLDSANLSLASLSDARLQLASLGKASLARAKLFDADLESARMDGTDCTKASFIGANLTRATLRADLTGAFFHEANLKGAELGDTDLTKCHSLTAEQLAAAKLTQATRLHAHIADDPRIREAIANDQAAKAELQTRLRLRQAAPLENPDASAAPHPTPGEEPT
ncbi:pentapeptide repeat-containing protein [Kitasatospora sp. NPDC059646]|uniref:pentapeptide repeat-containing protein n=1 Tax=Kitasatospora sp. NPDC059646 TaxID=3346893 RepID=UPI0036ABF13B